MCMSGSVGFMLLPMRLLRRPMLTYLIGYGVRFYVVRAETTQGYHPPERKVANPPQKGAYAHAYYQEHKEQLKAERRERYAQQPKCKPKTFAELMADARKRLTARRFNGKG